MFVGDIEADGLLDEITKLHCFVLKKHKKDDWWIFTDLDRLPQSFIKETNEELGNVRWGDLDEITKFIQNDLDILCIHNLFGYDLEALRLTGYIGSYDFTPENIDGKPVRLIDTLSMSRCLYPDRPLPKGCPVKIHNPVTGRMDTVGSHGLQAWGYRVANAKPQVDDWRDQPLEVYVHRCYQDVIINDLTLESLIDESNRVAKGDIVPTIGHKSDWKGAMRLNNKSDFLMEVQNQCGVLFDKEGAEKLLIRVDKWMEDIAKDVEVGLPPRELPESSRPNFPSEPFKQDGEISSSGWSWLKRLGYKVNDAYFDLPKLPAKPFKKDGDLSASGLSFCEKMGFTGDSSTLKSKIRELKSNNESVKPLDDKDLERARRDLKEKKEPSWLVPMEISNQDDIKKYLVEQEGWIPSLWNTKDITRDQNKRAVPEHDQEVKLKEYIEKCKESIYRSFIEDELNLRFDWTETKLMRQLKRQSRFLITSPKLKDERGELCPSLEHLKGDMAKKIVLWLSLRNRRSVIQSKDENKTTGWLNNPRLLIDGRIGQGHSGVTNTNRYKHRQIVNIPKADPSVVLGKEMRSLFIAPEGKKILGYDGSNLEQFVAGSYAWIFDKGAYLESLKGDSHTTNAIAYSKAAKREVSRGEGKGVSYACLPVDTTDVLTKEGWKKYDQLSYDDEVLTHDETSGYYKWNSIEKIHYYKNKQLVMMENKHIGFESTPDHRWLVKKRRQKQKYGERYFEDCYVETDKINSECNIRNNSFYDFEDCQITDEEASLVAWLLSDGYYSWSKKKDVTSSSFGKKKGVVANICQSKNKYQKQIIECLRNNKIRYTEFNKKDVINKDNTVISYLLNAGDIRDFMDRVVKDRSQKHDVNWCSWVLKLGSSQLRSFFHSFWLADGHIDPKGNIKISQNTGNIADAVILCGNLLGKVVTKSFKDDKCITMSFRESRHITGQKLKKYETRKADVFCLTVPNSNFVIRQKGYITITGNCLYGAQAPKIASMLGVSKDVGQDVINAFWDTNYGLKKLKLALEGYWESTGKKYIRGIDGRKIYTRSKHSLVNALFQSCGAILMSLSGCYMFDYLKRDGYTKEDAQRLLYVHDEYQYEVDQKHIKIFTFDNEDEAKQFSFEDKLLSNVKKVSEGKWERYYCRIGELGNKSLTAAGKYLKMPVSFEAAYDIGNNLAETH